MRRDRRSPEAQQYRRLYKDKRWRGEHGIREQALKRDLYRCQRCGCVLLHKGGNHPRAAVVNHKVPHKGDPALFFDLENTAALCKQCHDGPTQSEERVGFSREVGPDGWPTDPRHPANRQTPAHPTPHPPRDQGSD